MKCDIIVPVYNQPELTRRCLAAVREKTRCPYTLIVIDNASDDETRVYLEETAASYPAMRLVRNNENLGWVKAVNQGLTLSSSPYVCIMNNDAVVMTDSWLGKLMNVAEADEAIGLVNPRFAAKERVAPKGPSIELDFCRGYCVVIKRAVIAKIGMLDEAYGMGYYDDDDLSVRAIRAGFLCVRANDVYVEHLKDATFSAVYEDGRRRAMHEENKRLFYAKWGRRLRVVVAVTKPDGREPLRDLAFWLARRQHIVYLWNAALPLGLAHINIRERAVPRPFAAAAFFVRLWLNRRKRPGKRYDVVLCDDGRVSVLLGRVGQPVVSFDIRKDGDMMRSTVEDLARTARKEEGEVKSGA